MLDHKLPLKPYSPIQNVISEEPLSSEKEEPKKSLISKTSRRKLPNAFVIVLTVVAAIGGFLFGKK